MGEVLPVVIAEAESVSVAVVERAQALDVKICERSEERPALLEVECLD
jgi:hypothetical protein